MKKLLRLTYRGCHGWSQEGFYKRMSAFNDEAKAKTGESMTIEHLLPCPGCSEPDITGGNICAWVFSYEVNNGEKVSN